MKEVTIRGIGNILRVIQAHRLWARLSPKNNIRIITTHHVFARDLSNFELLINYFLKIRKVITPGDFFRFYKHGDIQGKLLLMTFDDGLLSSYFAAKKILSKYQIKALFFIPTKIFELKTRDEMKHFIARHVYFNSRDIDSFVEEEFLTMSKEHILDLYKDGHMILPHTHTHRKLNDIHNKEELDIEITKPKNILESLLNCKIDSFAFPVGTERDVSSYSYDYIKQEYRFCFTGLAGINTLKTDKHFFHRDCIHAHYNPNHVRNILDGIYDLFYVYKMACLKKVAKKGNPTSLNSDNNRTDRINKELTFKSPYYDTYFRYNKYSKDNKFSYEVSHYHDFFRIIPFLKLKYLLSRNNINLNEKKILIASSGSGIDGYYLKKLYPAIKIFFSDINLAGIEKLRSNFENEPAVLTDNHNMAFKNNSFDYVFIAASLHHLSEPIKGLYELLRIAKYALIVIEPNDSWLTRIFERLGWADEYEVGNKNYVYRFNKRDVAKIGKALFFKYGVIRFFAIHKIAKTRLLFSVLRILNALANIVFPQQGNYIVFFIKKEKILPMCMSNVKKA